MTPGVGLNTWKSIGSLHRELKPYTEYVKKGWNVKILTFDMKNIPALPEGLEAVRFPYHRRLLMLLPLTHKELGKWANVIKTNQSVHAYLYTNAAKLWKKPILLRCGYVHGEYLETTIGLTRRIRFYQWLEAKAFDQATHCQVPTGELSKWIQKRYRIPEQKISVLPNFVDTEVFKPMPEVRKQEKSVISTGRLSPVKQFDLLIRACAKIPGCSLTIAGEGPERSKLEIIGRELGVNLKLSGNVPNANLPLLLNQHQVFAITSKWEGHPKALIEAMACGMPCISVNSTGLRNFIRNNVNGLIVDPEPQSISNGISTLFKNNDLSQKIGYQANNIIEKSFSFAKLFESEFKIIENHLGLV
jgi:glycosyltransferase involved in cell wall biosynthesis